LPEVWAVLLINGAKLQQLSANMSCNLEATVDISTKKVRWVKKF